METSIRQNLSKARKADTRDSPVVYRFITTDIQNTWHHVGLFSDYTRARFEEIAEQCMSKQAMADRIRVSPSDEGLDIKTI